MSSLNFNVFEISNLCIYYSIGMLTFYASAVVSNEISGLTIDPNLRLAAESLQSLCSNFEDCGKHSDDFDGMICCLKCSCDPSCITTHSCCPESGYHPTGETSYTSGREGMVCRNGLRIGKPQGIFIHPEYEFLQRCPPDTPTNVKDNCNRAFAVNDSSLIRSLPLYDTVRGINYANMYCALCNNASEGNLAPWGPSVSCKDAIDTSALALSEIEELIFANECFLTVEPPEEDYSHTLCFNDVIKTCNATGNWAIYDVTAVELCDVLDMVYVSDKDLSRTYKNIFCAMCNGVELGVLSTTFCPFDNRHSITMSFVSVLQFTVEGLQQYTDTRRELSVKPEGCLGNFVLDPVLGRCMPVYCSSPHILDTPIFQCKTLFGKTNNAVASHTFAIIFKEALNFRSARNIAMDIADEVRNTDIITCAVSVFFQTYLRTTDSLDDVILNSTAAAFTGLFINVRYFVINETPVDTRSKARQAIEYMLINTTTYNYIGPDMFDAGMLQYITYEDIETNRSRYVISMSHMSGASYYHYMFHNPYDDTVIIGEYNFKTERCVETMYKNDYLQCPWLRFDVTRFSRTISGLSLSMNGAVVEFGFDEFKTSSINSTQVNVCSQAVVDKMDQLVSHQTSNSLSTICVFVITMYSLIVIV